METKKSNMSIGCSVSDCRHHNTTKSTCSLSSIQVGCCGPTTEKSDCTKCSSYQIGANH